MNISTDVLVVGAGMAGSSMALQLRTNFPHLSVTLIDQKTEFGHAVGESTVEMWDDYMTRVLKLGPFLERYTLQKHGLRFFFDNENKGLKLEDMSEMGRAQYNSIPARQIDRKQFDTEMARVCVERGVDVRLGVKVTPNDAGDDAISIDPVEGHVVNTSVGAIQCKWLVDACGIASPLSRKLGLREHSKNLKKGSYWSRYKDIENLDSLGSEDWKRRVNYTQRHLSTNHFMYRGYWIWVIVIDSDIVSIGIEFDRSQVKLKFRNGKEFDDWLRSHAVFDQILGEKSEQLDFHNLQNIAYRSKQYVSEDRWFLTGMSGSFSSVLGSSACRTFATSNLFIEEIIKSDLANNKKVTAHLVNNINDKMDANYEGSVRFLDNLDRNGSFETWYPFFNASLALYFNSNLPAITNLFRDEIEEMKESSVGASCWQKCTLTRLRIKIAAYADEYRDYLDRKNLFYKKNSKMFENTCAWEEQKDIHSKTYHKRDSAEEFRIASMVYKYVVMEYIKLLCNHEKLHFDSELFLSIFDPDWYSDSSLMSHYEDYSIKAKSDTAAAIA